MSACVHVCVCACGCVSECVCMCGWVHACMRVYAFVYISMDRRVHVGVRGQYLVYSSGAIALSFEMGSLTGPELADSFSLADQ